MKSVEPTEIALRQDWFAHALQRDEEHLERERRLGALQEFDATAPSNRPLMESKLGGLSSLDDARAGFAADQQRLFGYVQVPTDAFCDDPDVEQVPPLRAICSLEDGRSVACAPASGPVWVYNWREGVVTSRPGEAGDMAARGDVGCLCAPMQDGSMLGAGDDDGALSFWNLADLSLVAKARIHQQAVTSLAVDRDRLRVVSTSKDTYIASYDVEAQSVVEHERPHPLDSGVGIPNSVVSVAGNLIMAGGVDGKLRIWGKDSGSLRRQHTLDCNQKRSLEAPSRCKPSRCRVASDGWRLVVSTRYLASAGGRPPGRGGLLLFDLRRLGGSSSEGAEPAALLATVQAEGLESAGAGAGVPDVTLIQQDGEATAVCVMDGAFRAFSLDTFAARVPSRDGEGPASVLADRFEPAFLAQPSAALLGSPFAMEASHGALFTATDAPSLDVWRWMDVLTPQGHDDYEPPQPPARVVLRSRCVPFCQPGGEPEEMLPLGSSLNLAQAALDADRQRHADMERQRRRGQQLARLP